MINNLLSKLAFRQTIPDLRTGASTGFMDDQTGAPTKDPRLPDGDIVQISGQKRPPQRIALGEVPDLERPFGPKGVEDTTGGSSTGYVHGGHSV